MDDFTGDKEEGEDGDEYEDEDDGSSEEGDEGSEGGPAKKKQKKDHKPKPAVVKKESKGSSLSYKNQRHKVKSLYLLIQESTAKARHNPAVVPPYTHTVVNPSPYPKRYGSSAPFSIPLLLHHHASRSMLGSSPPTHTHTQASYISYHLLLVDGLPGPSVRSVVALVPTPVLDVGRDTAAQRVLTSTQKHASSLARSLLAEVVIIVNVHRVDIDRDGRERVDGGLASVVVKKIGLSRPPEDWSKGREGI